MQNYNNLPSYVSMAHGAATTGNTYTQSQITNLINFNPPGGDGTPVRRIAWRVDLLDASKNYLGDLTPWVTNLSLVHDTGQPVHRTLTLDMVETAASQSVDLGNNVVTSAGVDYVNDLVQVWCGIGAPYPDTGYILWPQGVFKFRRPGARVPDFAIVRHADMLDLSCIPQEQAAIQGGTDDTIPFTLPAGAPLISVVYGLLVNGTDGTNNSGIGSLAGMPGCNIPTSWVNASSFPSSAVYDAQVPSDYTFGAGTTFLEIINTLLKYLNMYDLWVDENGVFQVTTWPPNQNYTVLPSSWTFDTQSNSIVFPGVSEDFLLDDIANVVQVRVEDANRNTFYAIAVNNDPSSPYSVNNWGFNGSGGQRVVKVITDSNIPSSTAQNWVQLYANQQLIINAYLTDQVTMETAVVPLFQDHDVVALNIEQTDVTSPGTVATTPVIVSSKLPGLVVSERFLSTKWQIDAQLSEPSAGRTLAGATGYTTLLDARNTPSGHRMTLTLNRVTSVMNPTYIGTS